MAAPTSRRSLWAIGLLSGAVLLYEIAITRVLSVVLWYHWSFLCISLAMLGLGVPGIWFSAIRRPMRLLQPLMLLAAVLVPGSIVLIVKVGGELRSVGALFCMLCILPPLLCLGGAVCLLLMSAAGQEIGRMYGSDLLGACLAAVVIIPLLHLVPTPALVGALGLLPLAAHALLHGRVSRTAVAIGLALVGGLVWQEPFALRYTKAYDETTHRPIYEKWTPTVRLAVFDSIFWAANKAIGFGWGQGRNARPPQVRQYWVEQDGAAGTPLTNFRGKLAEHRYLLDDATSVGLELRAPRRVAIVGVGGGRDILAALLVGARHVEAIELNGHLVAAVSERFRDFSGDVYHLPGVHAVVSEGRSHLSRSTARYDLIQLSLTDSWAATAAGAFALSENNLYTVEAFRLYVRRLSEDGMLATSRWALGPLWTEVPRLVLLLQEALRREGIAEPNRHLAVVVGGWVGTVLASRTPIAGRTLDGLVKICRTRGFDLLYPPTAITVPSSLPREVLERGPGSLRAQGLRLDPPSDDRPFFFQVLSPFARLDRAAAQRFGTPAEAVYVLQILMLVITAATVLLFFLPFALPRQRLVRYSGFWRGSLFFFCIGAAFMLVEIPWLQRFILYLGHPSYATTVVLACLLLGASLGAMTSSRVGLVAAQRLGLLLPLLLIGVNLVLSAIFSATLGAPLALRVALSVVLLTPAAFLMGFFFPLGMTRFGDGNKPWFWAMNGAASVLASVVSLGLAMELGFTSVGCIGAACYLPAWLALLGSPEPPVLDWSI